MIRIVFILMIASPVFGQVYSGAESAEYDPMNDRWLVSNGNSIIADDGTGNLSFFGTGDATHGMEVVGNVLWVIDGNDVVGYDLLTEQQIGSVTVSGASFLNGMTNNGNDMLWVTDFSGSRIYAIDISTAASPSSSLLASQIGFTPNGIVYDAADNRLLMVAWGMNADIYEYDLSNDQLNSILGTSVTNIDGIDDDSYGHYYISSWSPARITRYDSVFTDTPVTVTTPALSSPADIGYSQETDVMAIPMGNRVIFVDLAPPADTTSPPDTTTTAIQELSFGSISELQVYPNPISEQTVIAFDLGGTEELQLNLYDAAGKLVAPLLSGKQQAGKHRVLLAGLHLNPGTYILQFNVNGAIFSRELIAF